jgi:hypothetical protein
MLKWCFCFPTELLDRTNMQVSASGFHYLTESLKFIARTRYDAFGSKNLPRPVVLLSRAIITDNGIAIMLAVPEHATAEVLGVCLQLAAIEVTTSVIAKVVEVLCDKSAGLSKGRPWSHIMPGGKI